MIYVICGLIGSGKSTFAHEEFTVVLECEGRTKESQIAEAERMYECGRNFAYITCFPTKAEMEFFEGKRVKYLWIDTTAEQSRKNIMKRKRIRDLINLREALEKNEKIMWKKIRANIPFVNISLFENGEKW